MCWLIAAQATFVNIPSTLVKISNISQGVAHTVVLDMMQGMLNLGYHLIMDNSYSSPALMKELYEKGTYAYGTLRSTRKNVPKDIKEKHTGQLLKKGGAQYFTCLPVLTGCWVDRNFILFCSNFHNDFEDVDLNRQTYGSPIRKPAPILDYNKSMEGVDLADQMLKYYHTERRSIKRHKKLFSIF
ncbi:piggyBac transposable element-derived protein 4-like [Watersipora subatra]|uniref:piggyBac transposable element-derived protein 4-like n=1 Tax=Watersipora subatra TaxID=2589382 RepID=UPI00355C5B62